MIYYHATPKDNVLSIIREGLKGYPIFPKDGYTTKGICLCKSAEDCLKFCTAHSEKGKEFALFRWILMKIK